MRLRPLFLAAMTLLTALASAAEQRVTSPGGKLTLVVSDDAGLRYRVEFEEKHRDLGKTRSLSLRLQPDGGYAAVISPQ